jgi:hypothetical protein
VFYALTDKVGRRAWDKIMEKKEMEQVESLIKPEEKNSDDALEADKKQMFLKKHEELVKEYGYDFGIEVLPKIIKVVFPKILEEKK